VACRYRPLSSNVEAVKKSFSNANPVITSNGHNVVLQVPSLGKQTARYKPQDHNSLLLPVVLSQQILPGSFAFALNYLVDHELDLNSLDAKFKNDETRASAYDPRVMLKIVLLAYSQVLPTGDAQGLIGS